MLVAIVHKICNVLLNNNSIHLLLNELQINKRPLINKKNVNNKISLVVYHKNILHAIQISLTLFLDFRAYNNKSSKYNKHNTIQIQSQYRLKVLNWIKTVVSLDVPVIHTLKILTLLSSKKMKKGLVQLRVLG